MLVVISDLHFIDGTAGDHNLPYDAFKSVFLSDIASLVRDKGAIELKILLLGDIIDLLRSTKWLEGGFDSENRPWGKNGLKDIPTPQQKSPTEKMCLEILGYNASDTLDLNAAISPDSVPIDSILAKNWKTFKLFRGLTVHPEQFIGKDITVEIIYLPGNHDRLCNLYPSLRKALKELLGLTINEKTVEGYDKGNGNWRFKNEFIDEDYWVCARHGHEYDPANFYDLEDLTQKGFLQVPIGDIVTTEFATRIPFLAYTKYKREKELEQVIKNLQEIDNVRPYKNIAKWLYYKARKDDRATKVVDEAVREVIKDLLKNDRIQNWKVSGDYHKDGLIRAISDNVVTRWLAGLVVDIDEEHWLAFFLGMSEDPTEPDKDPYLKSAYKEEIWRRNENIRYILYGHTHTPLLHPMDCLNGREIIYINTGTWRKGIFETEGKWKEGPGDQWSFVGPGVDPDFIEMKQITYIAFYNKDEDKEKVSGTVSYDVWTGNKKKYYL